ncbi:MAG: hypothetical protein IJ109_07360 [Firmicutes bacterium]|nr:hypothetical protein [Bacillota bacterium]
MRSVRSKLLAIMLAIMVTMSFSVPAFAEDAAEADPGEKEQAEKVVEKETEPPKEEKTVEQTKAPEETRAPEEPKASETDAQQPQSHGDSDGNAEVRDTEDSKDAADVKKKGAAKAASAGNAVYKEVNNATDLADGDYQPESFTFTGGTGKTKLSCDKITVSGGKAKAVIRISSTNFTHLFTGKIDSDKNTDDVNTDLYDPDSGKLGKGVYQMKADGSGMIATIPVSLGSKMDLGGRTTAMSEAHWIDYTITVTAKAENRTGDASLEDGTYKPDSFTFTGGTGKATMTCEKVVIKNGKAYAVLKASSANMTHLYMGTAESTDETPALYDPKTGTCGKDVTPISSQTVTAEVMLNQDQPCAVRTTAMSAPHWVNYTYHLTLNASSEKISDSTDLPESGSSGSDDPAAPGGQTDPSGPANPGSQTDPVSPAGGQTLTAGTYKVKATTDRKMFYLYPKESDPAWTILTINKDKTMTATITLTGDGYDYVYMGTPAQAKKAGKNNWIKARIVNGYYTFTIPVSALDKKLTITPHSKKYESDGDPKTDPWRPDKWIIFYSKDAQKTSSGASITTGKKKKESEKTSGTQTKFKNNKKADKVSKWKDDSSKSTSAVNNSTSLKDGVYTPDRFSWSGGSGRLAYIRCNKITVTGGKAYATIEFGSSKYDSLKANGRVYSKQGGGNSKFVIPVKLNANNTIIGRTTAMSQPHWVKYNIFIYKAGAGAGRKAAAGTDGHVTNTKKLTDKAPDLLGLKVKGTENVKYAKYFKIFRYENDITLVSIDQGTDTALEKKETAGKDAAASDSDAKAGDAGAKAEPSGTIADQIVSSQEKPTAAEEADAADATAQEAAEAEAETGGDTDATAAEQKIEYDEEGKPIAKSDNEITNELYQNNVVNYLIVPKGAELPAGLDKDCVIITKPVKDAYIASEAALDTITQLGHLDSVAIIGMNPEDITNPKAAKAVEKEKILTQDNYETPEFRDIVRAEADLVILPGQILPKKLTKKSSDEDKALSEEQQKILQKLQTRYSSLSVPMMIDRSEQEATNFAAAEWVKVYGVIAGEEKAAAEQFDQYIKKNKEEKISHE